MAECWDHTSRFSGEEAPPAMRGYDCCEKCQSWLAMRRRVEHWWDHLHMLLGVRSRRQARLATLELGSDEAEQIRAWLHEIEGELAWYGDYEAHVEAVLEKQEARR